LPNVRPAISSKETRNGKYSNPAANADHRHAGSHRDAAVAFDGAAEIGNDLGSGHAGKSRTTGGWQMKPVKLKHCEPYATWRRDIANLLRFMRRDGKAELARLHVARMKDCERKLVDMILEGKFA
jgi:hypothetical protein